MKKSSILKMALFGGAVLLASLWAGRPVQAFPDYLKIYAADPYSRAELRAKCSVCHVNPQGGGERNDFGKAFQAAGRTITPALRAQFPDRFNAAQAPNVKFLEGSDAEAVVEIDGKQYLINTRTKTVKEAAPTTMAVEKAPAPRQAPAAAGPDNIYRPADVRLVNLPTAIAIPKGSLWTDFTHRFPFGEPTNAKGLFGLDTQAYPSFGFIYGLTDRFHVGAYRSPGDIGRPIMVYAGASLLSEEQGHPFTAMARVGLEGRDNFQRNFTTSFEVTIARSLTRHAQLYFVPTVSVGDRPYNVDPSSNEKGETAVALGVGGSFNIRPSVALLAEANYRVNEAGRYRDVGLGIRRPVIGFGIQKASASRRHSFSLTFSNGPGTTFAQRSQTRGLSFADDGFQGLTIGFNLSRRLF